ncbi:MAG: hypothetical protein AB2L14_32460 [Candidatus Xenobiia bacterium LiM19]
MILTFDPTSLRSSFECVEFLAEKGIKISQKLGARILSLNSSGIQISPVVLEDASPGSKLESFLLSSRIMDEKVRRDPYQISQYIMEKDLSDTLAVTADGQLIKLVSRFELEGEEAGKSLLPVKVETSAEILSPSAFTPQSVLSDRRFMEEMTLTFLDSDNISLVIESLRKLTRVLLINGKDPVPLLLMAFSRQNPEIWSATSSIIKETLDYDMGTLLLQFFSSDDDEKKKDLFSTIVKEALLEGNRLKGECALQIFITLLEKQKTLALFMSSIDGAARLMRLYPAHTENFLKSLLYTVEAFTPLDLTEVKRLLIMILEGDDSVKEMLYQELSKSHGSQSRIMLSWIMSALDLDGKGREQLIAVQKSLLLENVKAPHMLNMMKAILVKLLPLSLLRISELSFYTSLEEEARLLILEIWEEYYSQSKGRIEHIAALTEILLEELNGSNRVLQRMILTMKAPRQHAVAALLKDRLADTTSLLEAAVMSFHAREDEQEREALFSFLINLTGDSPSLTFELTEKRHYLDEDITDHLTFLASFAAHLSKHSTGYGEFCEKVIQFLSSLSREGKEYRLPSLEAMSIVFRAFSKMKRELAHFIRRVMEGAAIPREKQISIFITLLNSSMLHKKTRIKIESFLIRCLKERELGRGGLTLLLEEINILLAGGIPFISQDALVEILGREIALKLTTPTISEMMRNEAQLREPSRFLPGYEYNPWTWDDVTQALFIMRALFRDSGAAPALRERVALIFTNVVHHYCTAKTDRLSMLFLSDAVVFRIIRETVENPGLMAPYMHHLARMSAAIISLLSKSRDITTMIMNEDLLSFLYSTGAMLKDEQILTKYQFPFDFQKEACSYIATAFRNGSTHAGALIANALESSWLRSDNRAFLSKTVKSFQKQA